MKTLLPLLLLAVVIGCSSTKTPTDSTMQNKESTTDMNATDRNTVHDFTVTNIIGEQIDLSEYEGRVLLIVNVASRCGYTKHYSGLEQLYRTYKDRGLVVLGFPANDFGEQEPGTDKEIAEFCKASFNVTFPMFSKITVKGEHKAPLYAHLTSGGGDKRFAGALEWNFVKFLIDRNGNILHRFNYKLDPLDPTFVAEIERALQ